jgi:hypothetical protein
VQLASHKSRRDRVPKADLVGLPEPSPQEKEAIQAARDKLGAKPRSVKMAVGTAENGGPCIEVPHPDESGWLARLAEAFGTGSIEFALAQLKILTSATNPDAPADDRAASINTLLAAVSGVQPRDEVEGSLAVQMAVTHSLAMQLLVRAHQAQHMAGLQINGNMALKLMKTYAAQVEALAKLRRGGNQMVRVEHVHVHSGGQAIVGAVSQAGGGGGRNRTVDQPHAPAQNAQIPGHFTAQPVTPVWRQNEERDPVSVTRGERAQEMPDAWWRQG